MLKIETKIAKARDFLEKNTRGTFREWNQLCLNIKGSFRYDGELIKNKIVLNYNEYYLELINLEKEFEIFFDFEVNYFFDYARELFENKNIDFDIYQTWRSGGYLYLNDAYDYYNNILNEMLSDLDNKENYYYLNKKDMHQSKIFKNLENIKEVFEVLKDYKNKFEKNINDYFYEYLENNMLNEIKENLENEIKQKQNLLNNL